MASHAERVEQLRWKKFPVLDDGFVCLVDIMGDDQAVVQAARVSYGAGHPGGLRRPHADPLPDAAPAHDAVRDGRAEIPRPRADGLLAAMDPASHGLGQRDEHPLLRGHRRRAADRCRRLAQTGHSRIARAARGSSTKPSGAELTAEEAAFQQQARAVYQKRLERGVAREQARKDLPLSTYTEAYWKIDLHNLLHFLELRMDARAQLEIRQYAETMGREIVAPLLPLVWEAFLDYRVEGMSLTRLEQEVIARLVAAGKVPADEAAFLAAGDPAWAGLARCRERDECREKLVRLGLLKPVVERSEPHP